MPPQQLLRNWASVGQCPTCNSCYLADDAKGGDCLLAPCASDPHPEPYDATLPDLHGPQTWFEVLKLAFHR